MSSTRSPDKTAKVIDAVRVAGSDHALDVPTKKRRSAKPKRLTMDVAANPANRTAKTARLAPVEKLAKKVFPEQPKVAIASTAPIDGIYEYEEVGSTKWDEQGFGAREFLLWFICIILLIGIIWWLFGLSRAQRDLRSDFGQSVSIEDGEQRLKNAEQEITDLYDRLKNNGLDNTTALIPNQIASLQSEVEQLQTDIQNVQVTGVAGAQGPQGPPGTSGGATCPNGDCVSLQASSPGTVEVGNLNISGVVIANAFEGVTLTVTNANVTANLLVGGNLTVSGTTNFGTKLVGSCADLNTGGQQWVWVPGSAKYGTLPGFCVMKYEAKNDGSGTAVSVAAGTPWVSISQRNARLAAQTSCDGCHLISEPEWMTIAENILWQPENWCALNGTLCNNAPGTASRYLTNGHTDTSWDDVTPQSLPASTSDADECYQTGGSGGSPTYTGTTCDGSAGQQRRVFTLSNGEVLWDIAGNVWEWTDATVRQNELPSIASISESTGAWREYTALDQFKGLQYLRPPVDNWNSSQRIGQLYTFSNDTATTVRGFLRGGAWNAGTYAGVFALYFNSAPTNTYLHIGFRVAR